MNIAHKFIEAEFIERPNRFLTRVRLNGKIVDSIRYHVLKALGKGGLAERIAQGLPTDSEASDDEDDGDD